jgi:hypothetical protein
MAVPAHDERDFAFAKKFGVPTRQVIMPSLVDTTNPPVDGKENTFRNLILAIVYDPKTKKYLVLKWKEQGWTSFITGGVEDAEDRGDGAGVRGDGPVRGPGAVHRAREWLGVVRAGASVSAAGERAGAVEEGMMELSLIVVPKEAMTDAELCSLSETELDSLDEAVRAGRPIVEVGREIMEKRRGEQV